MSQRLRSESRSAQGPCSHARGLTLPSRGRPPAGFARLRPPLTSNVRPRASQMRSMLVHTVEVHRSAVAEGSSLRQFVKQHMHCIGAGRPSVGGRRTVLSCQGLLQQRPGLSVLRRPAHQRFGSENMHRPNGRVCSEAVPSSRRSMKRSLSPNSMSRAATHEANTNTNTGVVSRSAVRTGALVAQAAEQVNIRARSVLSHARPNPSVNRTSNSGLRPLSAAGYLER